MGVGALDEPSADRTLVKFDRLGRLLGYDAMSIRNSYCYLGAA